MIHIAYNQLTRTIVNVTKIVLLNYLLSVMLMNKKGSCLGGTDMPMKNLSLFAVVYENFFNKEINGNTDDICVQMLFDGTWKNLHCTLQREFVCETGENTRGLSKNCLNLKTGELGKKKLCH